MRYNALYALAAAVFGVVGFAQGHRAGLNRAEPALESLRARVSDLEASGPCEPVIGAYWAEIEPSWRWAWPPVKFRAKVQRYRSADLSKVLARIKALGPSCPILTILEERGPREREIGIGWDPVLDP